MYRFGLYRRALPPQDKPYFDMIAHKIEAHYDAHADDPFASAMLSALIELQKEVDELRVTNNIDIDNNQSVKKIGR